MKKKIKSYRNEKWYDFAKKVKIRDNGRCLKCGRDDSEVVLQVHHKIYKADLEPWEYPLSDCLTLCKGCHARTHNRIEADRGWSLLSIDDLGGLFGICEREGCGTEIRYEHVTYHPVWGYKCVGSSCVEHLTKEDLYISKEALKTFTKISDFVANSVWSQGVTKNGSKFLFAEYAYHIIRIYEKGDKFSFQILIKSKGIRWFNYKDVICTKHKNIEQVKELAFITLRGMTAESEEEKQMLRNIYKSIF